jgi:hypothetical protein
MIGAIHEKIVNAAILFLATGSDEEKRLISGYFINNRPAMEGLGVAAMQVDYYQDLAYSACGKDNIVIANGHCATALNHFLFADGGPWRAGATRCFGYAYSRVPTQLQDGFVLSPDNS